MVFIGEAAWHMVERKVVKSCCPMRWAAPARIASSDSGFITRQTCPASSVAGARRTSRRNR